MPDAAPAPQQRRSRFWLLAPFVLLALVAAGWTVAWFRIRDETSRALDAWIAREKAFGRQWTCADRAVGGFPFRIEVSCASLALQRPDFRFWLGDTTFVAQVYQPRHYIAQVTGPFRASDGRTAVQGTWRRLEASFRTTREGLQRASLVVDWPEFRLTGAAELSLSGQRLAAHVRPHPTRAAGEGAYDWAVQATKLALPGLDFLVGGSEPADLDLQLTATQVRDIAARPLPDELERWRAAGGRLEITALTLVKGARRIEGKGQFGLDEAHRPYGRADMAAIGLGGLLGTFAGPRAGATATLLGALTGQPAAPQPPPPAPDETEANKSGLKPLPPLRIADGRLQLGALTIPGIRIAPLY